MIKFLLKGILRDKNRSLLPIVIVSIGVSLTVFLSGYISGFMEDMISLTAKFETGHVKITTKAYAKNSSQLPNDLAMYKVDSIMGFLQKNNPDKNWVFRTKFGGLVDVADENGETQTQGPALGMALDIINDQSGEVDRLNIKNALTKGDLPKKSGEVLISESFAEQLKLSVGDAFTFFGTTMYGSMTFKNFTISGTVLFGNPGMDKGTIIVDFSDAQEMLDMDNAASEILGFFKSGNYYDDQAQAMALAFNEKANPKDEFAPVMSPLKSQNNLAYLMDYIDWFSALFIGIFVFAMSLVLWNTGLLGGLRRYQEFGIRLAVGESKGHIFRSLIYEAILLGVIGSIIGTIIGLAGTYALQTYGFNVGESLPNSTMMMSSVIRAKITPQLFYIGFIPGLFAMVLGNLLSGRGIYKRETAQLFKELEV